MIAVLSPRLLLCSRSMALLVLSCLVCLIGCDFVFLTSSFFGNSMHVGNTSFGLMQSVWSLHEPLSELMSFLGVSISSSPSAWSLCSAAWSLGGGEGAGVYRPPTPRLIVLRGLYVSLFHMQSWTRKSPWSEKEPWLLPKRLPSSSTSTNSCSCCIIWLSRASVISMLSAPESRSWELAFEGLGQMWSGLKGGVGNGCTTSWAMISSRVCISGMVGIITEWWGRFRLKSWNSTREAIPTRMKQIKKKWNHILVILVVCILLHQFNNAWHKVMQA